MVSLSTPQLFADSIRKYTHTEPRERLLLISPYIKKDALEYLLEGLSPHLKVTIITTWDLDDIVRGGSDLSIYPYCKEHEYDLYLNPKIHLKVICSDFKTCIFGSANFTQRGLALNDQYNYEIFSESTVVNKETSLYFNRILYESTIVTDDIHAWYLEKVASCPKIQRIKNETCPASRVESEKNFLISSLPMTPTPQILYDLYRSNYHSGEEEAIECAIHDVVIYNIPIGLSEAKFYEYLKKTFFQHPFIMALLHFIGTEKYFGAVKEWIQNNCTDVPVPSRRDLTGNIQVLYRWICTLSEGEYVMDIPKAYSQRIYKDL